jgi:DNA-binding CsgD family transcriptional regulator
MLSADEQAVVDVIEAEHAAFWMKDEAAFLRCYRRLPTLLRWGYWQGGGMFRRSGWDEVVAASVAHMRALPRPIPEFAFAGIANLTLRVAGDAAWASYDRHHPHVDGMLGHGPNGTIHLIRVLERHQGSWFIAATVLLDDLRPLAGRIEQAAHIYELSPAQSRLALAVAEGRSLPEFAAESGVSLNTARTHLRRVFAKAGATSQAGLVARLLSLTPPR